VAHVASRLAALRGLSERDIADTTTDNFFNLFSKVPRNLKSVS
jgi:TatD DNase family protein